MDARIWGSRGSLATPGAQTVRYGGNTSCVEVRSASGAIIVLDAGTGIRSLGIALARERPTHVHLLLTHMHLDHVEGLGFFGPLHDPGCELTVWGPRPDDVALRDRIADYVSPPLFPVPFDQIPARATFNEVWHDEWSIDGVRVTSAPVAHPGRTVGYRLEEDGTTLAYIPDNESALDPDAGQALAAGVDLLFHDAQYTVDEYATRVGWGHSSLPAFATFVETAAPGQAVMFHHDPTHADDTLEEMEATVRDLSGRDDVVLAAEGMSFELG